MIKTEPPTRRRPIRGSMRHQQRRSEGFLVSGAIAESQRVFNRVLEVMERQPDLAVAELRELLEKATAPSAEEEDIKAVFRWLDAQIEREAAEEDDARVSV